MAPSVTPDLAGFLAAQDELAQSFGTDLTWIMRGAPAYPPGTQINPLTQRPFDPTIQPTSGGEEGTTVVARAQVQNVDLTDTRLSLKGFEESAIGITETDELILHVQKPVWDAKGLDDAFRVIVGGERFDIVRSDEDSIGQEPAHRVLVTIQQI